MRFFIGQDPTMYYKVTTIVSVIENEILKGKKKTTERTNVPAASF
jgi:hypothetical protein